MREDIKIRIKNAYIKTVEDCGFNINAGQSLNFDLSIKDTVNGAIKYIEEGNKGCCFHASIYLISLLKKAGIPSRLIVTSEPTILEDGTTRLDSRASVFIDGLDIVLNPIEDIEFFEEYDIPKECRKTFYVSDTTTFRLTKDGISSQDAGFIQLDDFISRYGAGQAFLFENFYKNAYKHKTFYGVLSDYELLKSYTRVKSGE